MPKTTVKSGNPYYGEGGRMPSTTGNPSGKNRGNNPPASSGNSNSGGSKRGGEAMRKVVWLLISLVTFITLFSCGAKELPADEITTGYSKDIDVVVYNRADVPLEIEYVSLGSKRLSISEDDGAKKSFILPCTNSWTGGYDLEGKTFVFQEIEPGGLFCFLDSWIPEYIRLYYYGNHYELDGEGEFVSLATSAAPRTEVNYTTIPYSYPCVNLISTYYIDGERNIPYCGSSSVPFSAYEEGEDYLNYYNSLAISSDRGYIMGLDDTSVAFEFVKAEDEYLLVPIGTR